MIPKNINILNTAEVNGFDKQLIDDKIRTFRKIKAH